MRYDIESRLLKLERLLDQLETSSPRVAAGESVDLAALTRLRPLSQRLQLLMAEIGSREHVADWDAADGVTARLLIEDLTQALSTYRTATNAVDRRLARAADAIRDVDRILEREDEETISRNIDHP